MLTGHAYDGELAGLETTSQGLPVAPPEVLRPRLREPELAPDSLSAGVRRFMRRLTPQRIAQAFDAARTHIDQQMVLAHELEEANYILRGLLATRRAAVLRLQVRIESGDPDDAAANAAAEQAGDMTRQPWFYAMAKHLLRSIFTQWSAVELLYDTQRWAPVGIRPVEPARWHFDRAGRPGFYRRLPRSGDLVAPLAGKYAVMGYDVTAVAGDFALVRCVALLAYIGMTGLRDWGTMVDQWGIPFIRVQYKAGMPREQIQRIVDELLSLAARRVIATEEGSQVETDELPDQAPHEALQQFCGRAMARLILGQESSSMLREGQATGATLQADVRDDIRDDDALQLAAAVNETLLAPWCALRFGGDVAPPRVAWRTREEQDPEQRGRIYEIAQRLGLRVRRAQVYTDLGLDEPGADARPNEWLTLAAPAAPAPAFFTRRPTDAPDNESMIGRASRVIGAALRASLERRIAGAASAAELRRALSGEPDADADAAGLLGLALAAAAASGRVREWERRHAPAPASRRRTAVAPLVMARDDEALVRQALEEALMAFRRRAEVFTAAEFEQLSAEGRQRAFSVARVAEREAIERLRESLEQDLAEGGDWRAWLDRAGDVIAEQGLSDRHARAIYQTNVMLAHTAGRDAQAAALGAVAWRKLPSSSDRPRPEHAQHDGRLFALNVARPPWGHGCRCEFEYVFADEIGDEEPAAEAPAEVEL